MPTPSLARTLTISMIGNLFEWYDFALFGYLAPYIGKLFFPSSDPMSESISALGVFAAGFIMRPLGGVLFGFIGDRFGRKRAMVATILLMAIPTTLIGLLPTYKSVGLKSSLGLIGMRMLQGISMGGNYGGSITFTTEHSSAQHRGFVASFTVVSCLVGIMLGSATAMALSLLFTQEQILCWGWRLPFLLGVGICFVGFYMRHKIAESPLYLSNQKQASNKHSPLPQTFRHHGKTMLPLVLTVMLHDLSFYVVLLYMTTHLTKVIGVDAHAALGINTVNIIIACICTCLSGWLSDRVGRKPVLMIAASSFSLGTIPLMHLMFSSSQNIPTILGAQALMAITIGFYFGPLPALMVEAFPTSIRYSAIATTTNLSSSLFGGTAPMIVGYLVNKTGSNMIPAYYLTAGSVISLTALRYLKASEVHLPPKERTADFVSS